METAIFITLAGLLSDLVATDDCLYKECECIGTIISCIDRHLTNIPEVTSVKNNFTDLELDLNSITTIPAGRLPCCLTQISMYNNPLTAIDDSAFDRSATTIDSLTFSEVLFTRIPNAFLRLANLISLSIYEANILDWNFDVMSTLSHTIQVLHLENCSINEWPTWVHNFTHLKELSLARNHISAIPEDAFAGLAGLYMLVLGSNSLTSVPKALANMSSLTMLYLDNNRITDVTWLPRASKLMFLTLNNNHISNADHLSQALVPYANTLSNINLSNNRLAALPGLNFFTQVGFMDLSDNLISDPNSGSMPSGLYTLDLQSNSLSFIPKVLMTTKSVTEILLMSNVIKTIRSEDVPAWILGAELGSNLITELTDTSFPPNCNMQVLSLNSNPLDRISKNAFQNLPQLHSLSLQYSRLTRVPLGLASARTLTFLDLTGSPGLVCTCEEKSLRGFFITAVSNGNVVGDCGHTSISNFFNMLSPDCPDQ